MSTHTIGSAYNAVRLPAAVLFLTASVACNDAPAPLAPSTQAPETALTVRGVPPFLATQKIAFTCAAEGSWTPDICTINPDGSGFMNLTNSATGEEQQPAWSPDYKKIAYSALLRSGGYGIIVANADGTSPKVIVPVGKDTVAVGISWSPDGKRLAFSRYEFSWNNSEVFTVRVDGTQLTQLTNHPADDDYPVWSKDGTKLYFASGRPTAGNTEIYAMDAATGANVTKVTSAYPAYAGRPQISPDGTKLLYQSSVSGPSVDVDIRMANVDGTNDVVVFDDPAGTTSFPEYPAFSRDGKQVVFGFQPGVPPFTAEFRIVDLATMQVTPMSVAGTRMQTPAWAK